MANNNKKNPTTKVKALDSVCFIDPETNKSFEAKHPAVFDCPDAILDGLLRTRSVEIFEGDSTGAPVPIETKPRGEVKSNGKDKDGKVGGSAGGGDSGGGGGETPQDLEPQELTPVQTAWKEYAEDEATDNADGVAFIKIGENAKLYDEWRAGGNQGSPHDFVKALAAEAAEAAQAAGGDGGQS